MNLEHPSTDDERWHEEQEELFAQLLVEQGLAAPAHKLEIVPQPRPDTIPLSFAQQRLWFLEQWDPQQALYNTATLYRILGPLDPTTLERNLNEIVRRHEILRTTFRSMNGTPIQLILPELSLPLEQRDLRSIPSSERMPTLQREAMEIILRPFDLERGPLLRTILFHIEEEHVVLLLSMHHIITDGWSLEVLQRELALLFAAERNQVPASLPSLPIQYADFTLWQRERLQGELLDQQLAYWRRQLADLPAIVTLPGDHLRPATPSPNGAEYAFAFPADVVRQLRAISIQKRTTLFAALLATFAILLSRLSGQHDIVVGSPIANRTRPELENLIGFFVNTLVLRARLDWQQSFDETLTQVREMTLEAYAHQELPFEKLVEELAPERTSRHTPLFQILFILQNTASDPLSLSGLRVETLPHADTTTPFDLTVEVAEAHDALDGVLKYRTDLFEPATIRHLVECWQTLLTEILAHPKKPIVHLNLLPQTDRRLLLEAWNPSLEDHFASRCVHELFEDQVVATPTALALATDGERLSYAELNRRANQLAHTLLPLQTSAPLHIAVVLSHGMFQVIALLAILKAGGTFVCLDPDYPEARLQHIITEVKPACFITEHVHATRCAEIAHDTPMIVVNGKADEGTGYATSSVGQQTIEAQPSTNLTRQVALDQTAYIAYTSGSTGQPKGIVQSHRTLTHFIQWFHVQFALQPGKRLAHWAAIVYDASYCEIFAALCSGATLCQTNAATRYDPQGLLHWLIAERMTHVQTVPGFCKQLLPLLEATEDPLIDLEFVLLAGEVLPVELAARWLRRFPERPQLFNLYGPSEVILATYYHVQAIPERQATIPVGHPIPGRQILILDQAQNLCPPGSPGEIYIRSPYLSAGYLHQPEKTSTAFVPDPLNPQNTEHVYRTGDIGRWLLGDNAGMIEFLGRVDNQVKLRGIRVELEEIEAALQRSDRVEECAVAVHQYHEDQYIIAYVVPHALPQEQMQEEQTIAQLFRFLKTLLPEALLPTQIVLLQSLPRTASGKINRQALPQPSLQSLTTRGSIVAPRTPVEASLQQIWQDVLHLDAIAMDAHFFAIGGHSLLATQIVSRIRDTFHIDCSLRTFFANPTIAEMARIIEQQAHGDQEETESTPLVASTTEMSDAEKLLARLDQLSADEITALFDSMLTESTDTL